MRRQPQNGDLKKQLHERQPRIAALSDKQIAGRTSHLCTRDPARGFGNDHCSACHGSSGQLLAEVGRARSGSATSG
uniref:PHD finger protein 21B n=1 Tax=Homo sapiens TaxID=9606 RepID=B1AHC5_HUMAN